MLGWLLRRYLHRAVSWSSAYIVLLGLWPCLCSAQVELDVRGDEPAAYRAAIAIALFEYKVIGNFAEARAHFREAHKLFPNARTLRGLGMTEFQLQRYAAAISYLEQALVDPVNPLEGEERAAAEDLLARARDHVGRFALKVQPAGATVVTDKAITPVYAIGTLTLAVGKHVLKFEAPGHVSQTLSVNVVGGEERTLEIALEEPLPRVQQRADWYKSPWLWGTLGVVLVGAAAGTALGLQKRSPAQAELQGGSTGVALRGPP